MKHGKNIPSLYLVLIISLILLATCVSSCGANNLQPKQQTNTLGLTQPKECIYTSLEFPVCGADGKDYYNKEQALCFTTVKHIGHCQCSDSQVICGSDGLNHRECEALASTNSLYTIVKFIPCEAKAQL